MNSTWKWSGWLAALALAGAVTTSHAVADAVGDDASSAKGSSLKWTAHRAPKPADSADAPTAPAPSPTQPERVAAAPKAPEPPSIDAAARTAASNPRVALDDPGVSRIRIAMAPRPQSRPDAEVGVLRPRLFRGLGDQAAGDWSSPNRMPGSFRQSTGIQDPPGLLSSIFAHSPQGDIGRPMAASGEFPPPNAGMVRGRPLPEAPRFTAAPSNGPKGRVAMNADELPSVMTRAREGDSGTLPTPAQTPASPATPTLQPPAKAAAPTTPSATPSTMPAPQFESTRIVESMPEGAEMLEFGPGPDGMPVEAMPMQQEMWMGGYPGGECCDPFSHDLHCEDGECGTLPCCCSGQVCGWLRQFGRPYYGWRWYRDFSASAGITGFQNPADLGLAGNFGTNEYANWAMPFWNAFGIGWQLGVRGVQSNFQSVTINGLTDDPFITRSRNQFFLTTGFFTRAFEGRGLQFGAVWDYLRDNWYDDVDLAQLRGEISYVWHVHEVGFWGAANYDTIPFTTRRFNGNASTLDLYTAFYRLHFGDANEWKVWGGATENGDGIMGTLLRAPMTRSLALEGTFTYLVPKSTTTVNLDPRSGASITASNSAWNVSVNVVYYPRCRARRGVASPYRPLFEVADNGSMIRSLEGLKSAKP